MSVNKPTQMRGASRNISPMARLSLLALVRKHFKSVCLGCGIAVVLLGVYQSTAFIFARPIERLVVVGDYDHVDVAALKLRLLPRISSGFVTTNLEEIREELESFPWIYRVNIKRRWPSTIEIDLIEQRPLAKWGETGYLNHEGQFFAVNQESRFNLLPLLKGPEGSEIQMMRYYQMFAALLEPSGFGIYGLTLDARHQVSLVLDNGLELFLGSHEALYRLNRFLRLWTQKLSDKSISSIDLRYEFGAAVRFLDQSLAKGRVLKRGEG